MSLTLAASNEASMNDLLNDLLVDGFKTQAGNINTGLLQAVERYTPSRQRQGGSRPKPGSKPPTTQASSLIVDAEAKISQLYSLARRTMFGSVNQTASINVKPGERMAYVQLLHLSVLFPSLPKAHRIMIKRDLKKLIHRCELMLEEVRPDVKCPADIVCPYEHEGMVEHPRLYLRADDNSLGVKEVYCKFCSESWSVSELKWLGQILESDVA